MLFAASESAVTKKPRLRLIRRRSSSVRPFGSFHSAMSRLMLISCGIQWLAQAAMYFSQAHLYLNGTSWLTSALELMTRLSSTLTRRKGLSASKRTAAGTDPTAAAGANTAGGTGAGALWVSSSKLSMAGRPRGSLARFAFGVVDGAGLGLGLGRGVGLARGHRVQ